MVTDIKTLLDVDFGVIETERPEMSPKEEDVVDVADVIVALATCKMEPLVGVVAAIYRHAEPFQIAIMSVSVS
jgi:hypothetical protein